MTRDTWWEVNILSKFQLPSSYGLGETVFKGYFHKESLSELISNRGVCRTSPATPGPLIIGNLYGKQKQPKFQDFYAFLKKYSDRNR